MDIETSQTDAVTRTEVMEADWTLIFFPASRGCPEVHDAIQLVEVSHKDVCTGKMHGVWSALENQTMSMIRCEPVSREFVMRVMTFMGTWYRANLSGMFNVHKPQERERISARRIAMIMREPEAQVAYALRLLAVDEAVFMSHVNGRTEFSFNKLFI